MCGQILMLMLTTKMGTLGEGWGYGKGEKCYFIREEVHKGFLMPAGLLWDVASVAQAKEVT